MSDCLEKFFCLRDICKFAENCTFGTVFFEGHSAAAIQGSFIIDEYKLVYKTSKHVLCPVCALKDILGKLFSPICFHVSVQRHCWIICTCASIVVLKTNQIFGRFQVLSLASDMKPAQHTLFRDQVSTLVEWFANWNECEQTIALYTLLKRISTIQARFLSLILEHTFRDDSREVQMMQWRANDKGKLYGSRGGVFCFVYYDLVCTIVA